MTTSGRLLALTGALLVTFLWSTSYVFIKQGLKEINPVAFAAYRYALASIILTLFAFYRSRKVNVSVGFRRMSSFSLLGFTGYFVAQGLQFVGLYYLRIEDVEGVRAIDIAKHDVDSSDAVGLFPFG